MPRHYRPWDLRMLLAALLRMQLAALLGLRMLLAALLGLHMLLAALLGLLRLHARRALPPDLPAEIEHLHL